MDSLRLTSRHMRMIAAYMEVRNMPDVVVGSTDIENLFEQARDWYCAELERLLRGYCLDRNIPLPESKTGRFAPYWLPVCVLNEALPRDGESWEDAAQRFVDEKLGPYMEQRPPR